MSTRPPDALTRHSGLRGALAAMCVALAACGSGVTQPPIPSATPPAIPPQPLQGGAPPEDSTEPLPPDLQTMSIRELYITQGEDGSRTLRFSTTVLNAGDGPLDLHGTFDDATGTFTTTQRVLQSDGSIAEYEVGRFMFHPDHAHWHFEDFTELEVWTHGSDGDLDELMVSTGKATFCAVDEVPVEPDAPAPAYLECGSGAQGISAGWSDTYGAELPGQELDITGLEDGRYALRSTVDPAGRLVESDDENNDIIAYVEIAGGDIMQLEGP